MENNSSEDGRPKFPPPPFSFAFGQQIFKSELSNEVQNPTQNHDASQNLQQPSNWFPQNIRHDNSNAHYYYPNISNVNNFPLNNENPENTFFPNWQHSSNIYNDNTSSFTNFSNQNPLSNKTQNQNFHADSRRIDDYTLDTILRSWKYTRGGGGGGGGEGGGEGGLGGGNGGNDTKQMTSLENPVEYHQINPTSYNNNQEHFPNNRSHPSFNFEPKPLLANNQSYPYSHFQPNPHLVIDGSSYLQGKEGFYSTPFGTMPQPYMRGASSNNPQSTLQDHYPFHSSEKISGSGSIGEGNQHNPMQLPFFHQNNPSAPQYFLDQHISHQNNLSSIYSNSSFGNQNNQANTSPFQAGITSRGASQPKKMRTKSPRPTAQDSFQDGLPQENSVTIVEGSKTENLIPNEVMQNVMDDNPTWWRTKGNPFYDKMFKQLFDQKKREEKYEAMNTKRTKTPTTRGRRALKGVVIREGAQRQNVLKTQISTTKGAVAATDRVENDRVERITENHCSVDIDVPYSETSYSDDEDDSWYEL